MSNAPSPPSPVETVVSLALTGNRRAGKWEGTLNGRSFWMPRHVAVAFLKLAAAREDDEYGFVKFPAMTAFRLRSLLDEAGGPCAGDRLLSTGDGQEYRLDLSEGSLVSVPKIESLRPLVDLVEVESGAKTERASWL